MEEISSRILILKDGRKVIDGTLAEVAQAFAGGSGDDNLEEIFFRATAEPVAPAAPPILPADRP